METYKDYIEKYAKEYICKLYEEYGQAGVQKMEEVSGLPFNRIKQMVNTFCPDKIHRIVRRRWKDGSNSTVEHDDDVAERDNTGSASR